MTYNEILPLAEVKNYLRVDDDFTEDDTAIERMVRSALGFIEQRTNHIFQQRDNVEYFRNNRQYLDIYDHPLTYTGDLNKLTYPKEKTRFDVDTVTIDSVGYTDRASVPDDLIEAALQMIKVWYFEAEKQSNTTLVPDNVHQILAAYRRFTIG